MCQHNCSNLCFSTDLQTTVKHLDRPYGDCAESVKPSMIYYYNSSYDSEVSALIKVDFLFVVNRNNFKISNEK